MRHGKSSGEWEAGARIAGYTVLKAIGAGGMGRVYHAKDPAGREVAIKTIVGADPELILRFQREAEALAKVDAHVGVVRVHSAGTHEGLPYLVMDYLPGGSLYDRLRDGPLEPQEAAWVVRELARGLELVHSHGVLHRDLKPQNVLLDEDSSPHLADFGLARVQGAQGLTRSGTMLGTIGYMAPEQALGQSDRVDARTDVYGLGGILFHALTGRPPFTGKPHEAVRAVVESPPPSARALNPSVPVALDAICRRALARQPEQRHPSAGDLADDLEAYLAKPADPRPPLALLLGLACVVVLLALGVALALASRREPDDLPSTSTPAMTDPPPPPASPSPSPSQEARPPIDASRFPPGDCLRLARGKLAERAPTQADLQDAVALLLRATAEGEPQAVLELGLAQLELGHDAAGIQTLWDEFLSSPMILDGKTGTIEGEAGKLRLTSRLGLVLTLLEERQGDPLEVRRGFGVLEGTARDMHSHRILAGELPEVDWERLERVSRDAPTFSAFRHLLRNASDMALHTEQMDELNDLADDLTKAGQSPNAPLRLLERLAGDGQPDPFAWFELAEYYDDGDHDKARALELYLRVVDVEGFERIRTESRREAATALYRGEQGIPRDLERAQALLDEQTLRHSARARELSEKIEAALAEQASGGD